MSSNEGRRGAYPGSFNPPTIAHLAISEAALIQRSLDEVVWVFSQRALAKEHVEVPPFAERVAVAEAVAAEVPWLRIAVTDQQLLADIAEGFDVIIMGADKWHQIQDPVWYGDSASARDEAIRRLPEVAVAPRPPLDVPVELALEVEPEHHAVSSTAARSGAVELMLPAARDHAVRTGAWRPEDDAQNPNS